MPVKGGPQVEEVSLRGGASGETQPAHEAWLDEAARAVEPWRSPGLTSFCRMRADQVSGVVAGRGWSGEQTTCTACSSFEVGGFAPGITRSFSGLMLDLVGSMLLCLLVNMSSSHVVEQSIDERWADASKDDKA